MISLFVFKPACLIFGHNKVYNLDLKTLKFKQGVFKFKCSRCGTLMEKFK